MTSDSDAILDDLRAAAQGRWPAATRVERLEALGLVSRHAGTLVLSAAGIESLERGHLEPRPEAPPSGRA
ncbi:hypothetical protein [Coralloluteibacterium stylophorae]|uniref:Uncharacterized protein n=1 Tax=Coralloluteibacterium stylophorae TaxID=1776034 RepID=A0AAP2CC43_9GAMM|nr:hypothetical protein [Coralloluteibacterium stylophorae]MBS7457506.1 hypothetical protein [Coralloluteibacterium stylophorae]